MNQYGRTTYWITGAIFLILAGTAVYWIAFRPSPEPMPQPITPKEAAGTMAGVEKAEKYQEAQVTEADVQLTDQDVQQLIQNDEVQQLIQDQDFQKLMADPAAARLMADPMFARLPW